MDTALCDFVRAWPLNLHTAGVMNGGGIDLNNAKVKNAVFFDIPDNCQSGTGCSPKTKLDREKASSLLIDAIPLFLSKFVVVLLQEVKDDAVSILSNRFGDFTMCRQEGTSECQALVATTHMQGCVKFDFRGIVDIFKSQKAEQAEATRLLRQFLPEFLDLDSQWGKILLHAMEEGRFQVLIVDGTFYFNVHWYHQVPNGDFRFPLVQVLAFFFAMR